METQSEEKYLMFFLDEELYGIPILKVNEIIGLMDITPIPKSPAFLKGIINLRGKIIPLVDLRIKFNMPERPYDEQTCTIIAEIPFDGHKQFIGIIVDKVAEVVSIQKADIELPPKYGQENDIEFLTGIGKTKGKVIMLLDIEAIINCKEMIGLIKENLKTKEKNNGMD